MNSKDKLVGYDWSFKVKDTQKPEKIKNTQGGWSPDGGKTFQETQVGGCAMSKAEKRNSSVRWHQSGFHKLDWQLCNSVSYKGKQWKNLSLKCGILMTKECIGKSNGKRQIVAHSSTRWCRKAKGKRNWKLHFCNATLWTQQSRAKTIFLT